MVIFEQMSQANVFQNSRLFFKVGRFKTVSDIHMQYILY